MRNFIYIFLALCSLGLSGCADNDALDSPVVNDDFTLTTFKTSQRTLEEAASIASASASWLYDVNNESVSRTFSLDKVTYGIDLSNSRSGENDTLFYVFNFDKSQGFALVALDKTFPGLLAVSDSGEFNDELLEQNPGISDFITRLKITLKNHRSKSKTITASRASDGNPTVIVEHKFVYDTLNKVIVEPDKTLRWGQEAPEGFYCPNKISGCVNTALALIIANFTRINSKLPLTYKSSTDTLTYSTSTLRKHKQSGSAAQIVMDGCENNSIDIHHTIASLTREIGYRTNSTYYLWGTSTTIPNLLKALPGLQLRADSLTTYAPLSALTSKGLIMVFGLFSEDPNIPGHAWICDGVRKYDIHTTEWTREPGKRWEMIGDFGITHTKLVHFNWGNNGRGNGFFYFGVYDDSKVVIPDKDFDSQSYYKYDQISFLPIYNIRTRPVINPGIPIDSANITL